MNGADIFCELKEGFTAMQSIDTNDPYFDPRDRCWSDWDQARTAGYFDPPLPGRVSKVIH